ncbi:trypsin-like peptidase domain-containing protein [Candidatus Parcubacteria bacterium]|nr:trypsin-like peptidase domain-containing protein [Candidatus Parcubacteria bacterium]
MRRIIGTIILGALGALLFEIAAPFIAVRFPALERIGARTTVVSTTQRVTITGETALAEAIGRMRPVVVRVDVGRGEATTVLGSGIILTADGLVVTSADLVSAGATVKVVYRGQTHAATVVRRDESEGLTLLRIPGGTLPVAAFARVDEIRLGERVLAMGLVRRGETTTPVVTDGVVSRIGDDGIAVGFVPAAELPAGSVVATLDGRIAGITASAGTDGVRVVDSRAIEVVLAGK